MFHKWNKENIIFDGLHEADVWADSITNEIYARLYDSYDTPDYKIAYSLAFRLAEIKEFRVVTESTGNRYKVWVLPFEG
ncbi:hypothetical protein [Bacillus ndiopicus]|uniref:hypothetical protein n=1 Tax=Bacillus ndiopicus TaxID=1347368 RepID=UPI0005AB37B1|nr:hypothetical protein [Bacillus ndiopicus]